MGHYWLVGMYVAHMACRARAIMESHFVLFIVDNTEESVTLRTLNGTVVEVLSKVWPFGRRNISLYTARDIGIAARRNLGLPGRTPNNSSVRILKESFVMDKLESLLEFQNRIDNSLQ